MDGSVEPVNSEDLPSARLAAKVRELRAAQHLTQAQIAKRAGYTRTYVTLVESGTIVPGREVVARLDDALSAGGALLALRSEAESKRWAVQPASAPLSGPFEQPGTERPGPQFEPLAVVLARVESLSASTGGGGWVRGLELAIEDVVDRYEAEGPQRLSGEVVGLRRLVEDLRRDAPNKATGPQILGLAGRLSGLLGYMAVNSGRFALADLYWKPSTAPAMDSAMPGAVHSPSDLPLTVRRERSDGWAIGLAWTGLSAPLSKG